MVGKVAGFVLSVKINLFFVIILPAFGAREEANFSYKVQ